MALGHQQGEGDPQGFHPPQTHYHQGCQGPRAGAQAVTWALGCEALGLGMVPVPVRDSWGHQRVLGTTHLKDQGLGQRQPRLHAATPAARAGRE